MIRDKLEKTTQSTEGVKTLAVTVANKSLDQEQHPDLERVQSVILKDGPKAKKEALYLTVVNRHTGEVHHHQLTIKTLRTKAGQWSDDEKNTISISDEHEDEIGRLLDFLLAAHQGYGDAEASDYVVVTAPADEIDGQALQELVKLASNEDKADVLVDVLDFVSRDDELLDVLIERVTRQPQLFADAAAALNLATYHNAVNELERLITAPEIVRESCFQELLTEHPWMFGSEYSELLDRRRWTRDEQHDFVVRRTSDNYIELIEIKTPLDG